jgi:hypothetical protein
LQGEDLVSSAAGESQPDDADPAGVLVIVYRPSSAKPSRCSSSLVKKRVSVRFGRDQGTVSAFGEL